VLIKTVSTGARGGRVGTSRAHLAAIVEASDDAIFSYTLDGVILSWNRAAETMYGYTAAEAVGRSVAMLVPSTLPHELPRIVARLRRGERIGHYETVRRRKDGTRFHASLSISPIADHAGRVVAASAIARDVTERRRADAQARRLNAELGEQVARHRREIKTITAALARAYDTTIEGWSRALDLRDKETEGHSQRVTDLSLRLARAMELPETDLVHIRRGALLHDIGKMGIPDYILLKPGPLSSDEWTLMRKHPVLAYEMLTPIAHLRTAVDIPYCHHEKWDGSGYPRGLKAAEIPLSARIFALADVWDALLSDRPYRPALSRAQALSSVRDESGRHFDPQLADRFLRLVEDNAAAAGLCSPGGTP
jgi:PAS domain S-box-containing protein/putative nucleotidyltransferase with HDIG domain